MTDPQPAIYPAMIGVMRAVRAVGKDQRNEQQNFNFRGVDDVMNALHGPLSDHGVIVLPEVLERVVETRQTAKGAAMNVTRLRVRFTFYAEDGSSTFAIAEGEAQDSGDKATGKAHSMAYKTCMIETFSIPTGEQDADATSEDASAVLLPEGWNSWDEHDDYISDLRTIARELPTEAKPAAKQAFLDATGGLDPADNASWLLPRKVAEDYAERLERIEAGLNRKEG